MFLTGCKGTDIILYTRYTDFGKNYQFCCFCCEYMKKPPYRRDTMESFVIY